MTAKEFLTSASEMNRQIHDKEIELKSLRDLASGISGCGFGERLSGTRNPDPPFVRYTDKALELEKEIQVEHKRSYCSSVQVSYVPFVERD